MSSLILLTIGRTSFLITFVVALRHLHPKSENISFRMRERIVSVFSCRLLKLRKSKAFFSILFLYPNGPALSYDVKNAVKYENCCYILSKNYHIYINKRAVISPEPSGDWTKVRSFYIELALPLFSPRGAVEWRTSSKYGWVDQLRVRYKLESILAPTANLTVARFLSSKVNRDSGVPFNKSMTMYKGNFFFSSELYMFYVMGAPVYSVCVDPRKVPSPSCEVVEQIAPDISVKYAYSRNFVYMAPEIDSVVRSFLVNLH